MDAGRGSYLCGLVLGIAVGVAGTHVALSGRSHPPVPLPDLSIGLNSESAAAPLVAPIAPSEPTTAFAPPSPTVHAIATSPVGVTATEATSVEPPRLLPKVENAEPLPAQQPREDAELRAFIRDELQTLAASEHDIWYETLRDLSREDATEILRIWKLTRGVASGPISPELKQFCSLPIEKLIAAPPTGKPESDPDDPAENQTHHDEIRRLCHLNLANAATAGYKSRELMIFEQTDSASPEGLPPSPSEVWINVSQGKLRKTGRVLDCAIDGPGFFQVRRGDETLLTRCGRFVLDDDGRLAAPRSHGAPCPLEPAITVPKDCERLQIAFTGDVTVVVNGATQTVGTIPLLNVFDPAALEPAGDNLFRTTAASGTATVITKSTDALQPTSLIQGSVEESNVDAAAERRKLDALANSPL